MKSFLSMLALGLLSVTGVAATAAPAAAQERVVVRERTVVRHTGPRYRGRWHNRRVCERRFRHGRRVTVCRTVGYRR